MACMKNLSGKWSLSSMFQDWKLEVLELNSGSDGNVTGTARILIDNNPFTFRVFGNYNGASVDINAVSEPMQEYQFNFVGNCKGDNVFDGAIFGERNVPCVMKHLG